VHASPPISKRITHLADQTSRRTVRNPNQPSGYRAERVHLITAAVEAPANRRGLGFELSRGFHLGREQVRAATRTGPGGPAIRYVPEAPRTALTWGNAVSKYTWMRRTALIPPDSGNDFGMPLLFCSDADHEGDFDGAVPDPEAVAEAWEAWRAGTDLANRFVAKTPILDITGDPLNQHGSGGGSMSLRECWSE